MLLGKGKDRRQLIFYYHRDQLFAVRKGPFKAHLIQPIGEAPATPFTHPPPFLFQVENDPSERFDVASEHPDVVADLLREVEKHKQNLIPDKPQF
jgi:arylsulfatase